MKKGPRHFLGRKNPSLFDTNVKMKDMEDVELVLNSATVLDSGTASVRARPTVKHYSSSDSFQAFAVPTPKVPLFAPAVNGTKINGSVSDDQSSNGSTISVTDPIEGEIFVPAPPSMAPPPPPEFFFLPPPEFMGDLSTLQPPPMPAPKPPTAFVSLQEDDLPFFSPPPMSPVKHPERPKFAPPQPPTEKTQKTFKNPPPKPIRISSVPSLDSPPATPAPPPPVHTPTLSTFNPQSPAKVYSAPKTTFMNAFEERDTRPKSILLLEDAGAGPVVQKDAKIPTKPPTKSVPLDVQEVKAIKPAIQDIKPQVQDIKQPVQDIKPQVQDIKPAVQDIKPAVQDIKPAVQDIKPAVPKEVKNVKEIETAPKISPPPSIPPPPPPTTTQPEPIRERKPITAATLKEMSKTPKTPPQHSPQLQRVNSPQDTKVNKLEKPDASPTLSGKYSPLIDRKLRNLKTNEPSGPREASPLALLMAAKQREKHRSGQPHENSAKNEPPSDSSFNSLVNTKYDSRSSLNAQDGQQESPKAETVVQVNSVMPSPSPPPSKTLQGAPPSLTKPEPPQVEHNKPDLVIPFLPPPPEFDDLGDIEPPPAMRPPDPPTKKAPAFTPTPVPPAPLAPVAPVAPVAPPKPTPPPVPQQPPPPPLDTTVKTKPPPVQAKPKAAPAPALAPAPLPTPVTANQATLLNILKKKMQEMDHKMGPDVGEPESSSDDWGSPEDNKVLVLPQVTSQKSAVVNKSATLDMRELKGKVTQKNQEPSPNKMSTLPVSNGPSRHQYGMTFTVRPGTKQPITLVSRGES